MGSWDMIKTLMFWQKVREFDSTYNPELISLDVYGKCKDSFNQ